MKMLASIVTKNGGDILEVAFGLGISADFIRQHTNIKSHTIIECHPDVIKNCKKIFNHEDPKYIFNIGGGIYSNFIYYPSFIYFWGIRRDNFDYCWVSFWHNCWFLYRYNYNRL